MSSIANLATLSTRVLRSKPVHIRQVRNGGNMYYRQTPYEAAKKTYQWKLAQLIGFATGLWVYWGIYVEFDHLFRRFSTVDPSKWTDEELGIPPDYEEDSS